MNKYAECIYNGVVRENPTFVLMLGMCPTLAVTVSAKNGFGMGAAVTAVLILTNMIVSSVRNIIPRRIRIPAYIIIIAGTVSIIELLINAYFPMLSETLGIYIPLIVVNCIILGRAEGFASSHGVFLSACDGLGMGTGFTIALTLIGAVRELLGNATLFGFDLNKEMFNGHLVPASICVMAPGAFFVLAFLTMLIEKRGEKR